MKDEATDIGRLCEAINRDFTALKPFREELVTIAKHAAGDRYSENAAEKAVYVNLTSLYTSIVSRNLISKNPRVLLTTDSRKDTPAVSVMGQWVNDQLKKMRFAETMKSLVIDAFYCMGICKVALATPSDAATQAWNLKAGDPFAIPIHFGDMVFDMNARNFSEVSYIGHRYRAVKRMIEESELYDKTARRNLTVSDNSRYNKDGDEKISAIGNRGMGDVVEEVEDMVDLWEIYVPRDRMIYTLLDEDVVGASPSQREGKLVPLRAQRWIGPDSGPYKILSFNQIPGNIVPKGTIQDFINLEDALNNTYRKLVRQAHDQKNVLFYPRQNSEDAEEIAKSVDRGFCPVSDPKSINPVSMNGPNQGIFTIMREFWDRASMVMGNIETLGGLAAQAGTLGQEELLAQQSNGQIAGMQDSTVTCVSDIIESLCWYWWHDPERVMQIRDSLEGLPAEFSIDRFAGPWNHPGEVMTEEGPKQVHRRSGEMPRIKIDPYSMRHSTPQQKSNDLIQFVTQIWAPLSQMGAQQGIVFDFNEFLSILGEYRDMPEYKRILSVQEPMVAQEAEGAGEKPPMPADTNRTYTRKSVGRQGSENAEVAGMTAESFNGQMQ